MSKIAVIKTGGKQYVVKAGDKVKVEKLTGEAGDKANFEVLMTADADGKNLKLGQPILKDAKIEAKIDAQTRDKKVRVVHYKNKTRQHKVYGHRQPKSEVTISKIS